MAQGAIIGQQPEIPQPYDIGDIKISTKTTLGEDWVLCQGQLFDDKQYPLVKDNVINNFIPFQNKKTIIDSSVTFAKPQACLVKNGELYFVNNSGALFKSAPPFTKNQRVGDKNIFANFMMEVNGYMIIGGSISSYSAVAYSKDGASWRTIDFGYKNASVNNIFYVNQKYYIIINYQFVGGTVLELTGPLENASRTAKFNTNSKNISASYIGDYIYLFEFLDHDGTKLSIKKTKDFTDMANVPIDIDSTNLTANHKQMFKIDEDSIYFTSENKEPLYKVTQKGIEIYDEKFVLNVSNGNRVTPWSTVKVKDNLICYSVSRSVDNYPNISNFYYYNIIQKKNTQVNLDKVYFSSSSYDFVGVYANEDINGAIFYESSTGDAFINKYSKTTFPNPVSQDTNTFIKVK